MCANYSPEDEEVEVLEELDDESDDFDDSAGFEDSDEDDDPESDEPPAMLPDLPLSVLYKPPPLKVMPTGRKTFLTGRMVPSTGWMASVSESSEKACCTSMVSPVSTNL